MSLRTKVWTNFIFQVLAHMILQIILLYNVITSKNKSLNELSKLKLSLIFIQFILMIAFSFTNNIYLQFLIFSLLSFTIGLSLKNIDKIDKIIYETTVIFIAMFLIGVLSVYLNINLEFMGIFLFSALIIMLFARLFNFTKQKKYNDIVSIIIALFIIYDTNVIMNRNYNGNFVQASFDYFIDFVNLISVNDSD